MQSLFSYNNHPFKTQKQLLSHPIILRLYTVSDVINTLPNKYYNILKVKIQYVESDFHNIFHKKWHKTVICAI